MNIIYIHTHDTGRYIQPYGEAVSTPNLMRFAKHGTVFRNAYCVGPTCSPSRSGLVTGMMPHNNGMFGLAHRGFGLNDYSKHIANVLKANGYKTALCGVQHVASDQNMIGYDEIISCSDKSLNNQEKDFCNSKRACQYIEENKDNKFFLSYGIWTTHRPFPPQDTVDSNYVKPPFPVADNKDNREDMARFMASATFMDRCFGQVYDTIERAGIMDNTLVIFTTDHGIAFPYMKCNLYDTGIGVSLIMNYKNNRLKGSVSDSLVSQLDIFPTICELVGIEKPEWLQGNSMIPLFEGMTDSIRDEIYSEVSYHAAYEPKRCIRTNRYKLIRHYDTHSKVVPANIDDSSPKSFLIDNGYLDTNIEKDMLFDLYRDPLERINLVDDQQYELIYKELSDRLENWQNDTDDPLVIGQIAKPDGAIVNRLECVSPTIREFEEDGIR